MWGFSQLVNFPIFSLFSHFPFSLTDSTTIKQYLPHTAKAEALSSVWQRFAREKTNNNPLCAPPSARAVLHSVLGPDTSLLLCLHTGAHRSTDTSTKEPQARGWTNHKVQQSRKDANYLLAKQCLARLSWFCVEKGAKIKAGWKIGGFVLMEILWIAQVWKWLHCNYTAT